MPIYEPINSDHLADEMAGRLQVLPSMKTEPVRALRRGTCRQMVGATPQEVFEVALRLLEQYRLVAYELA